MTSPGKRLTALVIHGSAMILALASASRLAAQQAAFDDDTRYSAAAARTSRVKSIAAPRAGSIASDAHIPAYQTAPTRSTHTVGSLPQHSARDAHSPAPQGKRAPTFGEPHRRPNSDPRRGHVRANPRQYPATQAAYEELPAMESVMVDSGQAPPLPPGQMPLDAHVAPAPVGELLPYGPLRYRGRAMGHGCGPECLGDCECDAGVWGGGCGGLGRCGLGSCLLGGCCLSRFFSRFGCGGPWNDCGSCGDGSCADGMEGLGMGGAACSTCPPCDDWYPGKDLTLFGGVQGFKGPLDGGLNGNFGFHEGVNWSFPLWNRAGIGWQLGAAATQSDFAETMAFSTDRSQLFVTTGLFRRQMCDRGWQWGLVYDHLRDEFAQDIEVSQFRGELSFLFCGHELGIWSASGISDDEPDIVLPGGIASFEALDMYAFFYRRRLMNGGEGRLWAGATGQSDAIFGGDVRVPIACDWDLAGGFNYIAGDSDIATRDFPEAWNVGISLVWYVCPQGALRAGCSRYRPLFNVADNGSLIATTVRQP